MNNLLLREVQHSCCCILCPTVKIICKYRKTLNIKENIHLHSKQFYSADLILFYSQYLIQTSFCQIFHHNVMLTIIRIGMNSKKSNNAGMVQGLQHGNLFTEFFKVLFGFQLFECNIGGVIPHTMKDISKVASSQVLKDFDVLNLCPICHVLYFNIPSSWMPSLINDVCHCCNYQNGKQNWINNDDDHS